MQLEQLLLHISYKSVQGSLIREMTDICYHSGKVKSGSLFICLKGYRTDGHRYLPDAVARGAAAVVVEEHTAFSPPEGVTVIAVTDTRDALWRLSAAFFDFPAAKLRMVGSRGQGQDDDRIPCGGDSAGGRASRGNDRDGCH